ncbi:MAG TPA: helix-turn-helix transcriptional regulator, partial [Ktedonobacteraceae bacterium]
MSINKVSSSHFLERAMPILAGLEEGPLQVARLKRKIEQAYAFSLEPGTFYATLAHLERRGWVERARTASPAFTYGLTESGRATLQHY